MRSRGVRATRSASWRWTPAPTPVTRVTSSGVYLATRSRKKSITGRTVTGPFVVTASNRPVSAGTRPPNASESLKRPAVPGALTILPLSMSAT